MSSNANDDNLYCLIRPYVALSDKVMIDKSKTVKTDGPYNVRCGDFPYYYLSDLMKGASPHKERHNGNGIRRLISQVYFFADYSKLEYANHPNIVEYLNRFFNDQLQQSFGAPALVKQGKHTLDTVLDIVQCIIHSRFQTSTRQIPLNYYNTFTERTDHPKIMVEVKQHYDSKLYRKISTQAGVINIWTKILKSDINLNLTTYAYRPNFDGISGYPVEVISTTNYNPWWLVNGAQDPDNAFIPVNYEFIGCRSSGLMYIPEPSDTTNAALSIDQQDQSNAENQNNIEMDIYGDDQGAVGGADPVQVINLHHNQGSNQGMGEENQYTPFRSPVRNLTDMTQVLNYSHLSAPNDLTPIPNEISEAHQLQSSIPYILDQLNLALIVLGLKERKAFLEKKLNNLISDYNNTISPIPNLNESVVPSNQRIRRTHTSRLTKKTQEMNIWLNKLKDDFKNTIYAYSSLKKETFEHHAKHSHLDWDSVKRFCSLLAKCKPLDCTTIPVQVVNRLEGMLDEICVRLTHFSRALPEITH